MEKENLELREKLICVIKSNIGDIKELSTPYWSGGRKYNNFLFLEIGDTRIKIFHKPSYKKESITKECNVMGNWFWQKRTEIKVEDITVFDCNIGELVFEDVKFDLTKEEYNEIINFRKEKIKEKQLEQLTKLCSE